MQPPHASVATGPALAAAAEPLQVLTLGLGTEIFALSTEAVREVLDVIDVTEVPGAQRFIKGLINVRGKVVPVVDLATKLGIIAADAATRDSRIIVVEATVKDEESLVGILADRVHEVTELAATSLEETPRIGMAWPPHLIRAIGKRDGEFIIILDIERLFAAPEAGKERQS